MHVGEQPVGRARVGAGGHSGVLTSLWTKAERQVVGL